MRRKFCAVFARERKSLTLQKWTHGTFGGAVTVAKSRFKHHDYFFPPGMRCISYDGRVFLHDLRDHWRRSVRFVLFFNKEPVTGVWDARGQPLRIFTIFSSFTLRHGIPHPLMFSFNDARFVVKGSRTFQYRLAGY